MQGDFFLTTLNFIAVVVAITGELENISLPILFNVHCSSIWSNIISKNSIPGQINEKLTTTVCNHLALFPLREPGS